MGTLDALLAGIISEPLEETRWLVLADWLEENDDPLPSCGSAAGGSHRWRAELLRLHRRLIATCCEPAAHPERPAWQARVVDLIAAGVRPCVPQHTLELPEAGRTASVPLVGSFIPPGTFLMGSHDPDEHGRGLADEPNDMSVHSVRLTKGFFIGIHPVTQAQWKAVMKTDPSYFKGPNRPVEQVSWDECKKFCSKIEANYKGRVQVRLPTEAEWEYACRAGTTTEYHFGDVPSADLMNCNGSQTWNGSRKGKNRKATTDVGSFPANPWGLFDMHGNVWEWCQDAWDGTFYQKSPDCDPVCIGKRNFMRVQRGGTFDTGPGPCRAAYRDGDDRDYRVFCMGFRVCFLLI